jgi:hypothetical protein
MAIHLLAGAFRMEERIMESDTVVGGKNTKEEVSRIEISKPRRKLKCARRTTDSSRTSSSVLDDSACVQYSPVVGIPNKKDLKRALAEFERLEDENEMQNIHENERDVQVVLATGVKLKSWLASVVANTYKCVQFEAVVNDGEKSEAFDDCAKCDIIITKVVGKPHQLTLQEIGGEIRNYGVNQLNRIFRAGGGRERFIINAAGKTSWREPDVTLTRPNNVPTIIVELEDKNRSVAKMSLWCRGFLHSPGVRQVIGIKMYPPNGNQEIAALAIQYGYNDAGEIDIIDAVSFGQRDVVRQHIPYSIWSRIRFLPNPTVGAITANVSPWLARDNGFLTISRAECTFNTPIPLAAAWNDLQLDLFEILCCFCAATGVV